MKYCFLSMFCVSGNRQSGLCVCNLPYGMLITTHCAVNTQEVIDVVERACDLLRGWCKPGCSTAFVNLPIHSTFFQCHDLSMVEWHTLYDAHFQKQYKATSFHWLFVHCNYCRLLNSNKEIYENWIIWDCKDCRKKKFTFIPL